MNDMAVNIINCFFCWSIVVFAIAGYIITLKRTGERWLFWIVLAGGWGLLAIFETLLATGTNMEKIQITTVWLSSYLLVMASLLILFLRFIQIKSRI
jgi:hypothetical protein